MPHGYGEDVTDISIPVVMAEHSLLKAMLHSGSLPTSSSMHGKLIVSKECTKGGVIMDSELTNGDGSPAKGKHIRSNAGRDESHSNDDDDDNERAVKYLMHGGKTVFVSPKYVLDHGSDAGVLYVNAPQSSVMSKWSNRGVEVLSTGYGPKITPLSGLEIVLSNDPTGCDSIQNLGGRENVIIVVSKWTSKCNFLHRIKNIEASGATAAIFVFESNFLYPIGQTDKVETSKIKSKMVWEKSGYQHPYEIRIPALIITKSSGEALSRYIKLRGGQHRITGLSIRPDYHLKEKWSEIIKLKEPSSWPSDDNARRRLYFRMLKVHGIEVTAGSPDRHDLVKELYERSGLFWKNMREDNRFTDL